MAKVGRPLKFKDVKELEDRIEVYFRQQRTVNRPFTITGLALAIGMTSRKQLLEYESREEFRHTIKKAKLQCENYAEEYLFTGKNMAGVIFNLKNNYGWKDKQEIDVSGQFKTNWGAYENINLSAASLDNGATRKPKKVESSSST